MKNPFQSLFDATRPVFALRRILILLLCFPTIAFADPGRRDRYGDTLPEGAIQRLGTARMKHPGATRITAAPDGHTVVTLGNDRHVRIWSAQTGRLLKVLPYPPCIRPLDPPWFSEDGLRYVTIDHQMLQVWDVEKLTVTHRLPLKGVDRLTAVAFSPDPNVIATAEDTPREFRIRVWDLKKGTQREVGHAEEPITHLGFVTPTRLISCGTNIDRPDPLPTRIWDLEDSSRNLVIPHAPRLTHLQNQNRWLAVTGRDPSSNEWEIWDLEALQLVERFKKESPHLRIGLSANGNSMVLEEHYGNGWFIDILERATRKKLSGSNSHLEYAFSLDSKFLYLLEGSSALRKIDAVTGKNLWGVEDGVGDTAATDLQWMPDSRFIFVSFGIGIGDRGIYDSHSGAVSAKWIGATNFDSLPILSRTLGNQSIFSCTLFDIKIRPWQKQRLGTLRAIEVSRNPQETTVFFHISVSPDGKQIQLMSAQSSRTTYWRADSETGKVLHVRDLPEISVRSGGFSADGRLFRTSTEIYLPETGDKIPPREGQSEVFGLTLSDRTDLIAGLHPRQTFKPPEGSREDPRFTFDLRIWERFTGQTLAEFQDTHTVRRAFHPSGRFLATDHSDGIRIWNLLSGKLERFILAHDTTFNHFYGTYAYSLAFSPDGTKLASGHGDTTVLIWDTSDLPELPREKLDTAQIEKLWQQFREPDAKQANAALWKMAGSPETVLPFLKEHLRPVPKLTRKEVQPLLDQLESDDFRKREAAMKKVDSLEDGFLPLVNEILKGDLSEDLRRRLAPLPDKKRWNIPPTGEDLRLMRAVRLLETIGGVESLQLVEKLSDGLPTARATQEAIAARERMRHWR